MFIYQMIYVNSTKTISFCGSLLQNWSVGKHSIHGEVLQMTKYLAGGVQIMNSSTQLTIFLENYCENYNKNHNKCNAVIHVILRSIAKTQTQLNYFVDLSSFRVHILETNYGMRVGQSHATHSRIKYLVWYHKFYRNLTLVVGDEVHNC